MTRHELHREWQARPLHDKRSFELFLLHKLRESKESEDGWVKSLELAALQVEHAAHERDAANSALAIARDGLSEIAGAYRGGPAAIANQILALASDPSAALAERDRSIERKRAERCVEIFFSATDGEVAESMRREFNLDPKSEGVAAFFGTWPGDETDQELLNDLKKERF